MRSRLVVAERSADIGRRVFFAAAAAGRVIKARGTLTGNTIVFGAQDGEIQF